MNRLCLAPGSFPSLLSCIAVLNIFYSLTDASCYYPDGTDMNTPFAQDVLLPCDSGDKFGMCCALNKDNPDKCRSDGLCFSTLDQNVWRDGCSDPSWESPSCVKLCDSGIGQYLEEGNLTLSAVSFPVTPCDNGSYCCGNGTISDACCKENRGLFVVNGKAVPQSSTSLVSTLASSTSTVALSASTSGTLSEAVSSVTSSSSATAFTSTTASPSSTASLTAKPSVHTGVIVGATVGGFVAVLSLISGIFALYWVHRKHRNLQRQGTPSGSGKGVEAPGYQGIYEIPDTHRINELNESRPVQELEQSRTRYEI